MDSEQMSKDFLFFLDLCRKPENVFPEDSKELQLTRKWLNHLSSYECESTDEMRIVNLYMSHLCAALVKGTLYGPFAKEPPRGKLQRIDFKPDIPAIISNELLMTPELRGSPLTLPTNEMSRRPETSMFAEPAPAEYPQPMDSGVGYSQHLSNNPTSGASSNANRIKHSPAFESQGHINVGSTNLFFNVSTGGNAHPPPPASSCSCPPKPCQCSQYGNTCSCRRSSGGADTRFPVRPNDESISSYLMNDLNLGPDLIKKFDANLTSFIDQYKIGSPLAGKSPQSPGMFLPQSRPPSQERIANISPTAADPDYKEMREDICELLEAISAELRGTTEPGSSDYLERELSRYKGFVMSHSDLATHLKSLSSGMKLRYFLLLGLQNDLVKLLSDFLTPPQN